MKADGYPFINGPAGPITDQSSAAAWGKQDQQKRQEHMRSGKKLRYGPVDTD